MTSRRRIILTGATGLVGKAVARQLTALGDEVVPFRSRHDGAGGMNPLTGHIDRGMLEGAFAVIHLAGEPIAQRWSAAAKERILASRRDGTRLLAETLAGLKTKPEIFLSMSGVGRYGIRRDETLTETSPVSTEGFLGEVSAAWELATEPARAAGIRTTCLRTGVVLAASGGALRMMLPAFRLGFGGPLGHGRQQMSWIRLGDLVRLILWCLDQPNLPPALNAVAPAPCSQADFARALGNVLRRPAILPAPAWAVRLLFGQMGEETVLGDLRVTPAAALAAGFRFETPDLPAALARALGE
jgi:uncharacterized protein (TIGR01777 family)